MEGAGDRARPRLPARRRCTRSAFWSCHRSAGAGSTMMRSNADLAVGQRGVGHVIPVRDVECQSTRAAIWQGGLAVSSADDRQRGRQRGRRGDGLHRPGDRCGGAGRGDGGRRVPVQQGLRARPPGGVRRGRRGRSRRSAPGRSIPLVAAGGVVVAVADLGLLRREPLGAVAPHHRRRPRGRRSPERPETPPSTVAGGRGRDRVRDAARAPTRRRR